MAKSKTYCVMPHLGMSIQNHGDICVCNVNNLSFKKDNDEVFYIHADGLKDSWNSKTRTHIVDLLDSGVGHQLTEHNSGCDYCYSRENSGMQSQRTFLNNVFKDVQPLTTQPKVLIIKPGNVCNLSCRMCNPATSSSWYTDGYKLAVKYEGVTDSFVKWTKNFEHIRNGFNADNEKFWTEFDEWLPNLVFIDIYGGEPFLSNRLFESLGKVAASGESANISLKLHTNGTIYNEQYLSTLSKFKKVELHVSIDSHVPEHNNYIRYPVNGLLLLENLIKFKEYLKVHPNNIALEITCTLNTLNIFYYSEIYLELLKLGFKVGTNIVTDPEEYDIRILPEKVKQIIVNKSPKLTEYIFQEVNNSQKHFEKFWQVTKDLDQMRGQSFATTFPEYYECLKPYLNEEIK